MFCFWPQPCWITLSPIVRLSASCSGNFVRLSVSCSVCTCWQLCPSLYVLRSLCACWQLSLTVCLSVLHSLCTCWQLSPIVCQSTSCLVAVPACLKSVSEPRIVRACLVSVCVVLRLCAARLFLGRALSLCLYLSVTWYVFVSVLVSVRVIALTGRKTPAYLFTVRVLCLSLCFCLCLALCLSVLCAVFVLVSVRMLSVSVLVSVSWSLCRVLCLCLALSLCSSVPCTVCVLVSVCPCVVSVLVSLGLFPPYRVQCLYMFVFSVVCLYHVFRFQSASVSDNRSNSRITRGKINYFFHFRMSFLLSSFFLACVWSFSRNFFLFSLHWYLTLAPPPPPKKKKKTHTGDLPSSPYHLIFPSEKLVAHWW